MEFSETRHGGVLAGRAARLWRTAAIAAAAMFASAGAFGADNVWQGDDDGYWETEANWSTPSGDYWVVNNSASSKTINFNSNPELAHTLAIATDGVVFTADDATAGLRQTASDIRIGPWSYGSLEITGGTHEFNELAVSSAWWDNTGPIDGLLTINGGSLTVNTTTWIGSGQENNNPGSDGVVTVESGSLTLVGAATLGCVAGATGTLNVNGGSVTASSIVKGDGTATVNLDGGTLKPTADGTLIASGVTLTVGATESTIELTGQTVTIEGGISGTGSATGLLKVKGWGKLIVTGQINLDTLTISPNDYSSNASDTYDLTVEAGSVFVRHLYGAGNLTTTSGTVNTGDGAFYGKISGPGGFRTRGATTLYGLSDFTGGLSFAANSTLTLVSSLDGISPLWHVDASDADSITETNGKVTAWASQTSLGTFANTSSAMTLTAAHFGGNSAVLTSGSTLTSSWTDDGSSTAGHHTESTIGAICVESHGGGGAILLNYDGSKNRYVGRRTNAANWDHWVRMTASSTSTTDGIWQNSVYQDTAYHSDERIITVSGYNRQADAKSLSIGGSAGSVAIGELMGFTYNPTTQQRKQIETYLANKWNIDGMGSSLPQVKVTMASGATLDLGGLDVTVASFTGPGTVMNGTLRTVGNTYTQGEGALTIPAVEGATYYAASGSYNLVIEGASGKNVTIVVPDERVNSLDGYIFCEGDGVTFMNTSGETLDMSGYKNTYGWWASGALSWTGGAAGDVKYWSDGANWSGVEPPYRFQYQKLNGAAQTVTFSAPEAIDDAIWIENGIDGVITFTAESDTNGLSQAENVASNVNIGSGNYGALEIDGGTYHFANDILVGIGSWVDNARGDLTITSGRVETQYWLVLGTSWKDANADATWHTGTQGNVTMDGGELIVGYRDGATADNALIEMGRAAQSVTTFTQNGGMVSSQTNIGTGYPAMKIASGAGSTATYTISGGSYTARVGNVLMAEGENSKATLNLFGGTFTTEAILKGAGEASVNIDGGTLVATADGTFIADGISLDIGENGATINPNGHNITIDGDLTGVGKLTVTGYGSVTVNGVVTLPGLSFEPWNVFEGIVANSPDYTIKFTADSIAVSTLDGGAVVETANGVTAQSGSFYGTVGGAGGFTKTGSSDSVMAFQGLGKYSGDLKIQGGVFNVSSYLSGDMIYYDFDSSDTAKWSLEISDGVTNVNSMAGVAGLTFVPMFDTTTKIRLASSPDYFDGKTVMMLSEGSAYKPDYSGVWLRGKRAKSVFVVYQNNTSVTPSGNTPNYDYSQAQCIFDSGAWNDTLRFGAHNYQGSGVIAQRRECWYGFSNNANVWSETKNRWANHVWPLFIDGSTERSYVPGKVSVLRFTDCVAASDQRHDVFGRYEHTFNGAVAEVLGLSRQMPLEAYVAIEAYLMNKWPCDQAASYTYIPNVNVLMSAGGTLDLNGMDVTVASFTGCGTIKNGLLRTQDGVYRQGDGKLSIPAVEGATYVASSSNNKLEITGAAGMTVTVHLSANWLDPNSKTYSYIYCDGTVNFTFDEGAEQLEYTRLADGRYRFGSMQQDEIDFGGYGENTLDNANEEAKDDSESGLAFPGAYGWGRFAKGARASSSPTIYHVTNLNDSGSGSLRDAVSKPNRIIVFDVSGVIKISSRITFASNLYVAGQTAPGEGITVYGNGCSFSGSNNIICRYLRWRMGHGGSSGKDCAGIANGSNMIFDHCSFSWGLDETFSINPDGKGTYPQNITLQNCIFGQGLMTHSAGGLMQANYITLYRNLYVDNSTRNNKVKGINQYANNIVYNWKNGCYIMGGDSSGSSYCTIQSSLFINGPVSGSSNALGGGNSDFHFYGNDNWQDKDQNGVLDAGCIDGSQTGGGDKVTLAYIESKIGAVPTLPLYAGNTLLDNNLRKVGASLPYRDQSDCYMIDEVRSIGRSGGLITYENTLAIGAPDTWNWWAGTKRTDSDGDGIPDEWETRLGTNPNVNDSLVMASNGRYNIENYINSITAEDSQFFLRAPITLRADATTTHTVTLAWRDYTYGEIGFSVEQLKDGGWEQVGIAGPNETRYTVGNLTPGTYYNFRVMAVGRNGDQVAYSEPATLYINTRQEETGEVDIDNYEPNVTLDPNGATWNTSDKSTWVERRAYDNGDKVLLNTDGSQTLLVQSGSTAPESVVVNGTGVLTLNRACNLTGTMSLNKDNSGTLVLQKSTVNNQTKTSAATYTGKVVNHGGTIEFDTIADGGQASALGASTSDALNWIFDGGTYKYTGGSASTDRSATFRKTSTLEIANSGTTLTMTGAMEGTGDFILDGAGTLAIPDANTFFGSKTRDAIIRGGTLHLTTTGDSGSARNFANGNTIKNLHLAGGKVLFNSANEEYQTYSVPMYIEDGTENEVTLATHCYMNSRLIGNGDVQFNISHVRAVFKSNMDNFTGNITAHGNQTNSKYRPSFYHGSYWNYPNTRFNLTGTISMASKSRHVTCKLGGLSGESGATLSGSDTKSSGSGTTWYIGYANSDEEFAGAIDDYNSDRSAKGTTSVVKVGTGYWRLTGSSSHSGNTTVDDGELIVNGTLPSSSAVIVNDGGTLRGLGTINGSVTVNSGGTLCPGDETVTNNVQLTLSGAVTFDEGSRLVIPLARLEDGTLTYARPKFSSTATKLTINSDAVLEIDISRIGELKAGDKFMVFANEPNSRSGTFGSIVPAVPGHGLKWNLDNLYNFSGSNAKLVSVETDSSFVWDLTPYEAGGRSCTVTAANAAAAFDALSVKRPESVMNYISEETYKNYFKYRFTDNGNGTFTVEIVGIADEVVDEIANSAISMLLDSEAEVGAYSPIAVKPGLCYGISADTSPDIATPERVMAGEYTWNALKPDGDTKFIRIDIGVSETDSAPFTGASVLVAAINVGNGGTFSRSTVYSATVEDVRGAITLQDGAVLLLANSQLQGLEEGDSFQILDYPAKWRMTGEFASLSPATPGAGLAWDTSRLYDGSMTLAVVADITLVDPANPPTGLTEEQAEAIAENGEISAPDDIGLSEEEKTAYTNLLTLVVVQSGGSYSVQAVFTPTGTNTVVEAVEEQLKSKVGPRLAEIAAATGDTTIGIHGIPGLFYSVESGSELKWRSEGDRAQAGHGGAVDLTFPRYPGMGMGFYRILVNVLDK